METIVLPSEDRLAQHQLQSNWAMAGMISPSLRFSRSRRTRHPSSLIKWSVVSPQASESVHSASSDLSNPSPPTAVILAHFSPRSFYSLGCQTCILSRTTSLPSSFHDAEGECNRVYPPSADRVPKQFADKYSNLTKRTELTKSFPDGTSDAASVIDKENDSEARVQNHRVGQGKLVPPRSAYQKQNVDKLAEANSHDRKYQFQMQANFQNVSHSPQHELRSAMSIPRNGNRCRTAPVARTVSCTEITEDEKWAGPAYSKSPPPSSLPFPKFSVQPMRSLSLDLTLEIDSSSGATTPNDLPSPSQQVSCNSWDTTFATRDLKRILNLDQELAT